MAELHRIRLFEYDPSPLVSIDIYENLLVAARENGIVEIWNIDDLAVCIGSFLAGTDLKDITVVKWCLNNSKLAIAVGTLSANIRIYDFPTLKLFTSSDSYGGPIYGMDVSKEKDKIAVACHDGCVRVFSLNNGLELICSSNKSLNHLMCVCFDSDGMLYSGSTESTIYAIEPTTGRFVSHFTIVQPQEEDPITVWAVAAIPGGAIATGDSTGTLRIWDKASGTVVEKFKSHQGDILCIAAGQTRIYAAGIDPTIAGFEYDQRQHIWKQVVQLSLHTHDVTGIALFDDHTLFSCSKDACILSRKGKLIRPFQNPPPVASAMRDDAILIAGSSGLKINVWRLDGKEASKEVQLSTNTPTTCIAISHDGNSIAYSSSDTRTITFSGGRWKFDSELLPQATALCFGPSGNLFIGTFDGDLYGNGKTCKVNFPIFHISVDTTGRYIAVGGMNHIVLLDENLALLENQVPQLPGAFSTFEFQPHSKRLFIATGNEFIECYHLGKRRFLSERVRFGRKLDVAPNMISFDPKTSYRMLVASSQKALIKSTKDVGSKSVKLPFNDFLYVSFTGPKEIVVFEKPWQLIATNLTNPLRVKRFLQKNEAKYGRY